MIKLAVVFAASSLGVASAFCLTTQTAPRTQCRVKLSVLKPNDPNGPKRRRRPKKKEPVVRKLDPELEMRPLPLVQDSTGNYEALNSDAWLAIENHINLQEKRFPELNYTRFKRFIDNYRTQRGIINGPRDRVISAQTRFLDVDEEVKPILDHEKDFKFTIRMAARVAPVILREMEEYKVYLERFWTRDEITAIRDEPWELPPKPYEDDDDDDDPKASATEPRRRTRTAARQKAEEEKAAAEKVPEKPAGPPPPPPPPLSEVYSQLLICSFSLRACSFYLDETIDILLKYKKMQPCPRHIVLGRLPPGVSTKPRSDLFNWVYTVHIPLKGCENAGTIVGGEKVPWQYAEPIVFDGTYKYSMYNDGPEEALVLHVDFWHPGVALEERNMIAYFWLLWQTDKVHPSTRSIFTRRQNFLKENARREKEERLKQFRKRNEKKDGPGSGGGGGSIARK